MSGPGGGGGGLQGSLLQLQELLSGGDPGSAALTAHHLIRAVGQEGVLCTSPAVLALQTSLIFSKEFGLLVFIRKSLNIEEFRDCREEALKFLCVFLEKIGQKIEPYSLGIKNLCTSVYTKDKAAKCKIPSLELLIELLKTLRSSRHLEEFQLGELFSKFYGELALKTKVADTVLEKIYELLGVLGEVHPSVMVNNSEKLFRAFLGELKTQMTSTTREPRFPVVAGCLKGLSSLMYNFTKSMDEDPQMSKEIFDFAVKAISPQVDLKRYAVPLAGLRLFTLHASQFSTCLLDNYISLFEIMSKWCGHTNAELKKTAHSALDSFLKQVSLMVAKDAEAHKGILRYFTEQFYGIIRNVDSSSKELSIAIRGYGLFAGPCKAINAKDVDFMYIELIQRCKQMFLTETDTVEDHMYQLPSFLQSIASILLHLDTVPEVYTPVLERLIVVQIDSFPQYSIKMQAICCRAIVKVFLALAEKGPVLWNFISTVVHQGLIRVCSKPVILQKETLGKEVSETEDYPISREVGMGKWKVPTYKDYLDLFRNLLSCDQMKDSLLADETFLLVNSPLQSLNHLLYDELVKSVLKIVEKLDLKLEKQNIGDQENDSEASGVWIIPTSDPAANLHPAKPKDFTAFINLVEFCREILPEKHIQFFEPWIYSFGYELILQSTRLPLISGFYKLLAIAIRNAKKLRYFEGLSPKSYKKSPEDPEKYSCFALFAKFGKEVSVKMKQYKDELLASCLNFVLCLPHDIIELDIKAYVPALQMALKLGLSYTPLAEVGLNALEEWSLYIPKHTIQPYYKDILPYLDSYLKTTTLSDDNKDNREVTVLSRAAQKGFNKVVVKHLKKSKTILSDEEMSLEAVRARVIRVLGSLGGQINRNLVTAASSDEIMKKCLAWDSEKKLSFAVPFAEMKPIIYLDVFLPRVTELALSSSDRQTKIAACELLHSMVMFMLGKASQIPDGKQGSPPMYQLYKKTFPVLLRLACDVDQVTRQLYEPLVMQIIHWFTNNKKFESQDTVTLLETILDGIVDPVDSTLRDFCGQCVREFLKWSIKQTTPQQQEKSPVNTKSLFKRLYSFALHPNAFKRLGAALAFNNIYREFREEETLVEQFVFEALVIYMESLALTHADEKSLGTIQQCCDAIDHLTRIIEKKHVTLNKPKKRRLPRGFPPVQTLCLLDLVKWLLAQCGRPQTECRHKSIELFYKFVPLLPGNRSPSCWLTDILKKEDISFLINRFEGAGNVSDHLSGILVQPTLFDLQGPFTLRAVVQWMDMLLAALECYNTFIEERAVKAQEILGTKAKSSFLKAVGFFLENIALHDIRAAEKCFGTGLKGNVFSPQESEEYNYSKCTIVVRIMEFSSMLLNTCQDVWKLLEKDLLNTYFMELLVKTLCDPSSIGFNIADVQVMNNLPNVCVNLMKALKKSPYKESLEINIKKRITPQSIEVICALDLYNPDARFDRANLASILSACKQLHKAGLLHSTIESQATDLPHPIGAKLLSVVYKGIAPGDERTTLPSLEISSKRLASGLLELAFAFGGLCEELVNLLLNTVVLSVPLSGTSQKNLISFSHGEYFYSLFSEVINAELLKNLDTAILELMKSSVDNAKMVGAILNGMLDQSFRDRAVRKQQGMKLVATILRYWKKLDSWWAKDSAPESKMAVLTLMAKILQIDSSVSFSINHGAFLDVFTTYTSLLDDPKLGLNFKGQALIILPFFTNLTGERLEDLKLALEKLVASNFPMTSHEFVQGTLKYNNYVDCTKKFLDALELSQSPMLLQFMTEILCRDQRHVIEELFQTTFQRISRRSSCATQVALLDTVHNMFQKDDLSNITRLAFVDRCLLTLLWHCSLSALREFFSSIIVEALDVLKSRFTKFSESTFETQVTKKLGYYKMLEVLYSRLPKDDVHSKESRINQVFHGSSIVEGNELTKTLIKLCYDAFTENMAGETQLLEKRRHYHCAAYNCAIAILCRVFSEMKFYQGFLFTEKPEKNLFILENLIDLKHCYTFPVEVEVPMEKKKRYIAIRKEARDAANGDSEGPHYLSSLSYMADSSLSEEMSQFDFSTGVQSYSYSTQDSKAPVVHLRRRERIDSTVQDDVMELEMDELNQHECMTTMTALIKHMQRNRITPHIEEDSESPNLPPWMKFLHSKLENPSTPLNIRLFLAKLIINTEEVFRPYAKHWLNPLLQLVVSENNGGEGIHYMVVEIVVVVLSWTSIATPKGVPKDEVLANRLLQFLMKHVFHPKRAVFRHNLEIIKTVVECWKDCLSIPYRTIFEKFSNRDPNSKDNSVGIQLLGIIMANNLPPYDSKSGIENSRYFQALVNNMSFVKYKEVYAAAAEVLGLILQYIAKKENVLENSVFELVVKQLKQHQNTKEDKFIVCLNKVVKTFSPLADRFMNAVFFLLPKFHGVMKTLCLEVILCRAEEIHDLYLQLKSKDFIQIMRHRDDERQKVCLDIIYTMLAKLQPGELRELLNCITEFISHPSPVCREKMYNILMWIHDNYRDLESQNDEQSQEVFKLAKEILLQGLMDDNLGLQLIVRNFWSHETRLPSNILDRLLALRSLYSTKIEMHYLSLATNFLLEMTSRSPDYSRHIFEHPLSECKFQEYSIDSDWRYRSTVLTPMFIETQASQNATRNRSQEGSPSFPHLITKQIRATQQQYEFTPTQDAAGRNSFNWLTGNSIDTFAEYTNPSLSESLSSSLLFVHKRTDKPQRTALKSVGPNFGKKRLGLPGDEVDNKTKGINDRAEILRLRRRFLKDQEKLSLIYARKGVVEQKKEKEMKNELKMKHDAQVTLYRSYRQGDLPDIQIEYSNLINPLQAVAQRDPILAKQLFGSLFNGILKEVDKFKSPSEKKSITEKLLLDFNYFLNSTMLFFPPFISCIQEMSYQHSELLSLDSSTVSTSCLASLQQPVGILLLEKALIDLAPAEEPPSKRMRGKPQLSPDVIKWIELAKLYRSIGEYDVLRGIFSGEIKTKQVTQNALLAEAKSDYSEAAQQYNEALNTQEWLEGEPTEAEKDFWELASLECYNHLTEWKSLEYCSTISIDNENPPNLSKMWSEPFYQETYLPYMIRSKLKLLLQGASDQSLLTFIDEAMKKEPQKALIEVHYSQELSLLYILQDDFDRAKYYIENSIQIFMQNYSSIDALLHQSRLTKLQSVQALIEIQDFISFMSKQGNLSSQAPLKRLLQIWTNRYPDAKMDPMNIWDDIITNRCFFLNKIQEKLSCLQLDDSMEVDGDGNFSDRMEVEKQEEDIYSMIRRCKFSMKMKMIESARKQNNFSVAMKLLKELHRESKTREDWLVKWIHSYCRFSHSHSQTQSSSEQILTVLKTVSLLADENASSYQSKNNLAFRNQNILLGITYSIMTRALSSEPACLAQIEESKAKKILELSGANSEDSEKVIGGLHKKAFECLFKAARRAEDEVQSVEHVDVEGVIDAYMTLVDFCDKYLRKEEESTSVIGTVERRTYPALVVDKMLKALKLNSKEARLKFPRLLQILERYPEETLGLMTKEMSSIPCWQFIGWISQMMALLDKDEAVAVQHTVAEIADNYPQAIVYPFMISSESYSFKDTSAGHKKKEFVSRIKSKLDQGGVVQDFINALEQLSNPEFLFKDWADDIRGEFMQSSVNKKKLEKKYEEMYAILGNLEVPGLGTFRKKFIQTYGKEFDKYFGKRGSKLLVMKLGEFNSIANSLFNKMKEDSKPPGNLKECSPWMSNFKVEFLRNELEVPGQYDGKGKPLPEYHAKITGFDERVKVMTSLRRPKRITIRGNDEKEYPFLVKGGEDLRQDQRIEQLFGVMNIILSQDAACSQRNMRLKTYHVIPMTTRLGLIEWIENTCTLKELLLNNMSEEEKSAYESGPKAPHLEYNNWLTKIAGKQDGNSYMLMYKRANRTEAITAFRNRESKVPANLLRRAFVQMSTTPEAFLALRSHFASSHALMCISHWILGIGDRHLSNFMINMETGGMIGIDFGHAFGSATQFLPIPELMPFRLTRQFISLMLPMKETGLIYSVMVHALRAFRLDPGLLISTMDVFVKEPSLDWKNFEQKMLRKGGSWTREVNMTEINWYPLQKINYAKRKLAGANPAVITCDELRLGHEKVASFEYYVSVARGNRDHNIRAQQPEDGLSEEIQVKCLIDQATDPNVLGRTWIGWEPWM